MERRKEGCPNCGGYKYKKNEKVGCLSCDWTEESKREDDKDLKTIGEIKNEWA